MRKNYICMNTFNCQVLLDQQYVIKIVSPICPFFMLKKVYNTWVKRIILIIEIAGKIRIIKQYLWYNREENRMEGGGVRLVNNHAAIMKIN